MEAAQNHADQTPVSPHPADSFDADRTNAETTRVLFREAILGLGISALTFRAYRTRVAPIGPHNGDDMYQLVPLSLIEAIAACLIADGAPVQAPHELTWHPSPSKTHRAGEKH